jgi:transaldolase
VKIYYDGANIEEIQESLKLGIVSGVTTNLSSSKQIMRDSKINYDQFKEKIFEIVKSHNQKLSISFQVSKNNPQDIYQEALETHQQYKELDLKIKIPINYENLKVISRLTKEGVKINATCVTSLMQGIAASNAGCSYISFFWGRMNDSDIDARKVVSNFRNLLDKSSMSKDVKILVGSIRHQGVIAEAFVAGADIVTIGMGYFKKILNHIKSDEANNDFQKDWKK